MSARGTNSRFARSAVDDGSRKQTEKGARRENEGARYAVKAKEIRA